MTCLSHITYELFVTWKTLAGDLAMAMATSGAGFAPEQVSMELLLQLRGSRRELTLLPAGNAYVEDHIGECRATERYLSWRFYPQAYGRGVRLVCCLLAGRSCGLTCCTRGL